MLRNWLRKLVARGGRRPVAESGHSTAGMRLAVERLEERRVLSSPFIYRVTNTADGGTGSFRQAILDANANPGLDYITFNLPGAGLKTITPLSPLPTITDPVIIDGTTQLGYSTTPVIELDGSQAGANGLFITAGGSTVEGLDIHSFSGAGILLESGGNNVLQSDFIGTDPTGTVAEGNGEGVHIYASSGNTIGLASVTVPTLISGNQAAGILINGGSAGNTVQGASVGVNVSDTEALANQWGVEIIDSSGNNLTDDNVSGNTLQGALISGTSTGNTVSESSFGRSSAVFGQAGPTIANGTGMLIDNAGGNTVTRSNFFGNTNYGLEILGSGATGNVVENESQFAGNFYGLYINNAPDTTIDLFNFLWDNSQAGLVLFGSGTTGTVVQGDTFGTFPNSLEPATQPIGMYINGAPDNTLGGTGVNPNQGNFIISNTRYGVLITGPGATGNVLLNNDIGNEGDTLAPNNIGVAIINAPGNTVGGTAAGAANYLGGNMVDGVLLQGAGTTGTVVEGNVFGFSRDGTKSLYNRIDVDIQGASGNTIGGTAAGAGNLIVHGGYGVRVNGGTGNTIQGNSMYDNAITGIALIGGGNNSQPAPVLTSASLSGGNTVISGTLTAAPSTTYTLQFFASPITAVLVNVEGVQVLGSATVTTNGSGTISFSITLPTAGAVGDFISATATDPNGNTSAFSIQDLLVQ
jgi:hypothetical protein